MSGPAQQGDEPRVRRVAVSICENCLNGVPGQCHVPGCLFIRCNIEETPQPLRYMVEILDETAPTVLPPVLRSAGDVAAVCEAAGLTRGLDLPRDGGIWRNGPVRVGANDMGWSISMGGEYGGPASVLRAAIEAGRLT